MIVNTNCIYPPHQLIQINASLIFASATQQGNPSMQGKPAVIDALNALLVNELAARDQYRIRSRMLAHWGLTKAADRIAHEMADEAAHADALIKRILMLDGTPTMTPAALNVGADLPGICANDLDTELAVVRHLR